MTRRGLVLFIALGIAWGIPYLLIKIAVAELEPAMVVLLRCALGALLLLPLAIARRQVLPVLRRWRPLLAYTVAEEVSLILKQIIKLMRTKSKQCRKQANGVLRL